MPSIVEGYEYDIFISYRQNDNRSDKWVSNFVEALKDELEATELLLELNKDYPEYGDFHFLTRYYFDRAKAFAEAVANLKLPEPLVRDDGMELLKY